VKKLNKRGQITLFVIIAIVIVAAVVLLFSFFGDKIIPGIDKNVEEVNEVKSFMDECLKYSLEEAIDSIMLSGGLSFFDEGNYVYYGGNDFFDSSYVPYYFDVKKGETFPEISTLELELSFLIGESASYCFHLLNNSGEGNSNANFDISELSASDFDTKILLGIIRTQMNVPVFVKAKDSEFQIDSFEAEINSNYLEMYQKAIQLGDIQKENDNLLCFSCVDEFSKKENVSIKINHNSIEYPSYAYIYEISKFNPNRDKMEVFRFAHKFYNEE
jgi:hypothetical protein